MRAKLVSVAGRPSRRAPMIVADAGLITVEAGLEGDCKGAKHPSRQITVLAQEDWDAALADLSTDAAHLPWTIRRANLLVAGVRLPRVKGAVLSIGTARLEVTGQTYPCHRMDEAFPGLLKALAPNWRGGVTCRVLSGGNIAAGDEVSIESTPPEPRQRHLPG